MATLTTAASAKADFRESDDGYCCPNYHEAIRPGDEIYIVSTRCLPGGCGYQLPVEQMSVERYDGQLGWVESSWEEATAGDQFDCTSVFVHGNWMNAWWAKRRGWAMYHEMTRGWNAERRLRYVIWSWPTQPDSKSLASIRRNAARADSEAYYLAWFLSQLPPDEKTSLSAFSLGARVVSGALTLQAGGAINGRMLANRTSGDYRVVFFAAATTSSAFSNCRRSGVAMSRIERLVNFYNSADPVLKRYWLLAGRGNKAMGYAGASGLNHEAWGKVQQYDGARIMGRDHDWDKYACNAWIMAQAREVLCYCDQHAAAESL
ncbi:MAG: hypothetical protein ACIALR_15045 [Blastopirellula sp. JB062]